MSGITIEMVSKPKKQRWKTCPHCGGTEHAMDDSPSTNKLNVLRYRVYCKTCYARGPKCQTETLATKAYNRRTQEEPMNCRTCRHDDQSHNGKDCGGCIGWSKWGKKA